MVCTQQWHSLSIRNQLSLRAPRELHARSPTECVQVADYDLPRTRELDIWVFSLDHLAVVLPNELLIVFNVSRFDLVS